MNLLAVATCALLLVALLTVSVSPATKPLLALPLRPPNVTALATSVLPSYTLLADTLKGRAVMDSWLTSAVMAVKLGNT